MMCDRGRLGSQVRHVYVYVYTCIVCRREPVAREGDETRLKVM